MDVYFTIVAVTCLFALFSSLAVLAFPSGKIIPLIPPELWLIVDRHNGAQRFRIPLGDRIVRPSQFAPAQIMFLSGAPS